MFKTGELVPLKGFTQLFFVTLCSTVRCVQCKSSTFKQGMYTCQEEWIARAATTVHIYKLNLDISFMNENTFL